MPYIRRLPKRGFNNFNHRVDYLAVNLEALETHFDDGATVDVAAIVAMAWQATTRWLAVGQLGALLALVGAGLFMFSDAALAWNRFRNAFAGAPAGVLSTYCVGQCLIALSGGTGAARVDWAIR